MIQPKNPNLTEITSPTQAKRGNRQFFDNQNKVSYISYANGYVRREIKALTTCMWSNKQYKTQAQYQLNKVNKLNNKRVMEPCAQTRMDIIDRLSTKYKGYRGSLNQGNHTLIPR